MQLFISHYEEKGSSIIIKDNKELLEQLRKVLRAKLWYQFFVQDEKWEKRLHVELVDRTDNGIQAKVLETIENKNKNNNAWMLIAFPNKQEKLELIIQKLTELWISHIYLRKAERSLLKELNENKLQRIKKIMKEAVEQSWWWNPPNLEIISSPKVLEWTRNITVFDLPWDQKIFTGKTEGNPLLWIIWPEGWLTENDYQSFPKCVEICSLWETVLRMETAAIIWWWKIKNS